MIRSNLCDYNNAYIPVKETIEVPNTADTGNYTNKKTKFKIVLHLLIA